MDANKADAIEARSEADRRLDAWVCLPCVAVARVAG